MRGAFIAALCLVILYIPTTHGLSMKQNYRQRKLRKRPFLERKPDNLEKIPVYFLSKNLLQKDDAPEQNENTIASHYNGNPTPFKKSNKNSGNAKHRRRNFLERKPENLEKVLPLFLENGNGEVNIIPRQNGGIRNPGIGTASGKRVSMKQNYRQRKLRKRPFLERKPENFEKIPVYFLSKNLLQKDDAPEQNENTIASHYNGNPTPFKKSNKNSGNAKHRRRNFLERKPENLEKVLPLFLENGNGEVNIIPRQNGGIRNPGIGTASGTRGIGFYDIVGTVAVTNEQRVNGVGEVEGNEFNGADSVAAGASGNGGNGFNGANGAATGTNGNGGNGFNGANPTPLIKSNKHSGNAKHRRRNFLERKPENFEKVLPLFLENGNGEVNIIPRQNGGNRNDGSRTSFGTRGIAFNEIVRAFADTNGQGVNGAGEAGRNEFNDADGDAGGASENGGNGFNGVDGVAAGTHGNGGNRKRIGPRLAIEESGESTRSTNGGNEDQIESRVDFLPDTAKLRSSQGRPGRNVKQAGKIDGGDSEPARPKPKVAKKQKKRKSMKSISTFGDEWSDSSDCNSDSSDCYGSDNGYPRTRPRKVNINIILARPKFLQNGRRKFMPISATTEKNITKQNKQDVISSVSFGDCDSSQSECAYKYSSDSSDSSDSFEYRRQKIKTSVKSEANINDKRGEYFLSDSDSDSSEYRRHKNKPSVSFVDVKSERKMNNKRGGYVLSDTYSDSSEYRRHKNKPSVSFVDVKGERKMNNKRGGYFLSDSDSDSSEYRRQKIKTSVKSEANINNKRGGYFLSDSDSDSSEYIRQKIKTSVKSEANINNKRGGYFLSDSDSDSSEYRRQKIKTSVKSEANINNKRGGYVLSDSDSDSSEYRRHKNKPSVSFVDVKSERKINNKRGGYVLSDSDSDSSEYRRHKNKPSVSFVDVKSETEMNNKGGGYFTTDSDSESLEWIDDCDDSDSDSDCSYEYESDSSDYHNRFEKHSKQNGPDKIKQDESKPTIPRRIWSDSDSFEYYDWESSDSSDSSDDFNIRNRLKTGVKEDNKNFKTKNYFPNDYSSEYFEYYSDSDSREWDNSESYIYYDDK